jgi:flagellar biosynthesis/type III secretory pathway protein FliH
MDGSKIIKGGAGAEAATEPKLVKKDQFSAMLDAVTILDAAREQARAVLRDAEARRDDVFRQAREEGEAEGLARYEQALLDAHAAVERYLAEAEPQLVRLSAAIARKLVGEELRTHPDAIVRMVREALATTRRAKEITVKVHPSSVAELKAALPPEIAIAASETAEPGDCVIESEFGVVDARVETQLAAIERNLLRKGRQS